MEDEATKRKSKGGRPRKNDEARKDFVVSYRLNAKDAKRLKDKADRAGLSVNEYASRTAVTSQPRINRIVEQRFEFADRHAINRIGTTLFQLRQHAYAGDIPVNQDQLDRAIEAVTVFLENNIPQS